MSSGNSPFFVFMDRKSKLISWIFFVVSSFVAVALFSKFYILRDYTLRSEVACDPQSEVCFVRPCLEECEADAEPEYYKIQMVHASDVVLCDPHVEECPEIHCQSIASCVEFFCTEDIVPEEESCSVIEDFTSETNENAEVETPETSEEELDSNPEEE